MNNLLRAPHFTPWREAGSQTHEKDQGSCWLVSFALPIQDSDCPSGILPFPQGCPAGSLSSIPWKEVPGGLTWCPASSMGRPELQTFLLVCSWKHLNLKSKDERVRGIKPKAYRSYQVCNCHLEASENIDKIILTSDLGTVEPGSNGNLPPMSPPQPTFLSTRNELVK